MSNEFDGKRTHPSQVEDPGGAVLWNYLPLPEVGAENEICQEEGHDGVVPAAFLERLIWEVDGTDAIWAMCQECHDAFAEHIFKHA